ncbi:alpha/beta hydrolase [Verrucomicrobium spinosum]|uniref:alpha/beta hydrolase n=1 Tax=Verrucomicrobium spinosum TaxID=2736 RepID=UPI000174536D|nr:alpha/beta fold hydrolase [Verrucomicrobium spinosum]
MPRRWLLRIVAAFIFASLAAAGFLLWIGRDLAAPAPAKIGPPPASYPAQSVTLPGVGKAPVAGWLLRAPGTSTARGSVLLMHGIRSDRQSMVGRARFLSMLGYHTLCIDLQAHGESAGEHITMGHLESQNAAAAVAWLQREFPGTPVAVIGSSLGGVAALLARYEHPPQAIVVEAVFADVPTAVANRLEMRFGTWARPLHPLLTLQAEWLQGLNLAELSPVAAAHRVPCPLLVIHGAKDLHAQIGEGRAIYDHAPGPKEFWEIPGAAHVNLHRFATSEYESRVASFLSASLPQSTAP